MVNIADRSLYRVCSLKEHQAQVRLVRVGARVYDRSKQRIVITTPERRVVVTGPSGERVVYTEDEFLESYQLSMDEKTRKKFDKGKMFKVDAKEGAEMMYFLRVPAEQQFILYDEMGSPVVGNARNFALDHGEGDCIVCPRAYEGGPDLTKPRLINGRDFTEKFQF